MSQSLLGEQRALAHNGDGCARKCMLADPLAQHVKRRRKYLILQIPRVMCWNDGQESQSLSAEIKLLS